jgi:glutamate carboxypeptidase
MDLPGWSTMDDAGVQSARETGPALRWDFRCSNPNSKRRILWTIHYDTVYGPESPFQSCDRYSVAIPGGSQQDERMRGPGVIDAKGGIVVLRWAAMAIQKFFANSHHDLTVILTPDEEIGSPASMGLWSQIANEFDFAMLFEPSLADGSLVSERKGTGTYTFVVRGRAAHSGRNFHDGRNAINLACRLALALDLLNGQRPSVTINVGRIRGGDAVNVVPDLAVLRVNVRVATQEDRLWIETQVQKVVQELRDEYVSQGFLIECHGGIQAEPKVVDSAVKRAMEITEQVGLEIGQVIRWKPSGGASDGNKLAALGLPNIDTFGPEGDLLHSDQEWVRLTSLPAKALLAAMLLNRL